VRESAGRVAHCAISDALSFKIAGGRMCEVELSELLSLVGDPAPTPFFVDWPAVESWLGRPLPTAYKEIGSTFGPWYVGDWVSVEVPCADEEWQLGYTKWLRNTTRDARIATREHSFAQMPDFHPTRGGLLPWGETRRADRFFWDTAKSDPDEWPVVVYAADLGPVVVPWIRTDHTIVDFLYTLIVEGIPISELRRIGPTPRVAGRIRPEAAAWTPPPPPPAPETLAPRRRVLTQGSGLTALRDLLPPPEAPKLGSENWESVFATLGTRLPTEYVDLMKTYGGGLWRSDLRFPMPLEPTETGLVAHAQTAADIYRELRSEIPDEYLLPVWPEPGGFLAFADSIHGDYIGWLTDGDPDQWPVVVWPRDYEQGPPLATNLVDTLLAVIRGQDVPGFATLDEDDDPLDFATFTPWGQVDES
jgi:hypothetical protein